jgi:hypothetical protein
MPYYAIEESMLGPDNVTLLEPHQTAYVTFLAIHLADLIAYFEARQSRANGSVSIDDGHPPLYLCGEHLTIQVSIFPGQTITPCILHQSHVHSLG